MTETASPELGQPVAQRQAPASQSGRSREDAINWGLAAKLREYADLLEQQQADRFRVAAYRRAAEVLEQLGQPATELLAKGGRGALEALPAVGRAIAAALAEMMVTGRWSQLERLRGSMVPDALFMSIPGIGPELASRICSELHLESLAELEMAAYDGRLETVPGFGQRRLQMVRAALNERLGKPRPYGPRPLSAMPDVATLLDVDREYRERATAGTLPLIAPRRFNPTGAAWLPVLHTRRGPWQFSALFSNSRLAHELGRVREWVVIYFQTDELPEGQCTVVTERQGANAGCRVVRGREGESSHSPVPAAGLPETKKTSACTER